MNTSRRRSLQLAWRKIKRLIEFVVYGLFDVGALLGHRPSPNSNVVAIVHVKLLGDYVVWLPYGRALVRYLQQQGKGVVLVINEAVIPLASRHFADCELLGIDRRQFLQGPKTRVHKLRALRKLGAGVTYHDSCPRDAIVEDAIVRALAAPAWGFDAPFVDRPWLDLVISRSLYAHLLPPMEHIHQSERHLAFSRAVGVSDVAVTSDSSFHQGLEAPIQEPYFVVAPGASVGYKCWPIEYFISVARKILEARPKWRCIVVGVLAERALGDALADALGPAVVNLMGKTDLTGLVQWVAYGGLVLGNDSAMAHIAAACGVSSVAVVGGGHYGSFFPYNPHDKHIARRPISVSQVMDCFGCDWICRYPVAVGRPFPCIEAIQPGAVWAEVARILDAEPQR